MNFNASRNVNHAGGLRKAKRVSDVAAVGAPVTNPAFGVAPGYPNAGPPPPYQEEIQFDSHQSFMQTAQVPPAADFNYGLPQAAMPAPEQFGSMLRQPVVQDMAMQYGNQLAQQGKEAVQREFQRYVPVSRLRYYFAVDTRYVLKKLLLIMFPFTHKDWMVKYDQDTPVQPRYEINAPDLYIPSMGYVTYVLLAGFMLGVQQRFTPEQIGMLASSALAYIIFEMLLYITTLYITNTNSSLKTLDLLAYSGYKYIPMITSLIGGLLAAKTGYYCCLLYGSFTLSYFLVKSLRVLVLSGNSSKPNMDTSNPYGYGYDNSNPYADNWNKSSASGSKRRVYFLLFVAVTQPLLSWWLTYHLIPSAPPALTLTPS